MKNKELLQEDNTRLLALEECEHKIGNHLRRGLDATVGIGRELDKINSQELYRERGSKSLNEYCLEAHGFEPRAVSRFLAVADTVALLKERGLDIPGNESQVLALAQVEPEQQPIIWDRVQRAAEIREEPITTFFIQKAIDNAREVPATVATRGVKTSLDDPEEETKSNLPAAQQNGSTGRLELPSRISLSERGEAALESIRRHCGDAIAEAIEGLRLQVSERELITWADHESPAKLGQLVNRGFTVAKAIGFLATAVTEKTTVYKLLQLARANEGHYEAEAEGARITVELLG